MLMTLFWDEISFSSTITKLAPYLPYSPSVSLLDMSKFFSLKTWEICEKPTVKIFSVAYRIVRTFHVH